MEPLNKLLCTLHLPKQSINKPSTISRGKIVLNPFLNNKNILRKKQYNFEGNCINILYLSNFKIIYLNTTSWILDFSSKTETKKIDVFPSEKTALNIFNRILLVVKH